MTPPVSFGIIFLHQKSARKISAKATRPMTGAAMDGAGADAGVGGLGAPSCDKGTKYQEKCLENGCYLAIDF